MTVIVHVYILQDPFFTQIYFSHRFWRVGASGKAQGG